MRSLGLTLVCSVFLSLSSEANVLDLQWEGPAENEDETSLTNLSHYRVHAGSSSFVCPDLTLEEVASPTQQAGESVTFRLVGLIDGSKYFVRVSAVDSSGNESRCSEEASGQAVTDISASLSVRTLPTAQVFFGGNYGYLGSLKGTVPPGGEIQIGGLPSGKRVIRARRSGFVDAYRLVKLVPGSNEVTLDLVASDRGLAMNPTLAALEALIDTGNPPAGSAPAIRKIQGGGDAAVPHVVDWDNDGRKDLLVAGGDGRIVLYRNVGEDASPSLSHTGEIWADGGSLMVPGPAFAFVIDWNNDGGKDLIVGDGQGNIRWYRNVLSDAVPELKYHGPLEAAGVPIRVVGPAAPVVVDWDNDDKKDLLVGDGSGGVQVFINGGTDAAPTLSAGVPVALPDVGVARTNARPFVEDWDQDGRKDLLVGDGSGEIYVFLNSGTDGDPAFTAGSRLTARGTVIKVASNAAPFVVDWNNDGAPDLLIGENQGQVFLTMGGVTPVAGGSGGGGCFIATAAYGSPIAPQVQILRQFRDRYLVPYVAGRVITAQYYSLSPPLAGLIAGSDVLRAVSRAALLPVLGWAALALWSPTLGLSILAGLLAVAGWVGLHAFRRGVSHRRAWQFGLAFWAGVVALLACTALAGMSPSGVVQAAESRPSGR